VDMLANLAIVNIKSRHKKNANMLGATRRVVLQLA
jgi:hypothetical protein